MLTPMPGPLAGPMAAPLAAPMAGPVPGPLAAPVARPMPGPLAAPMAGPMAALPMFPTGGWPVPGGVAVQQLPANVQMDLLRPWQDQPKPVVTPAVMARVQSSMIAPDMPWQHNV